MVKVISICMTMEELRGILQNAIRKIESISSSPSPSSEGGNNQQHTNSNSSSSNSTNANNITRAEANWRAAFPQYMQGGRRQNITPLCNPPSRKKQKSVVPFVVKETWTHDFFLLASPMAEKSPTLTEGNTLLQAGLGKKRIVFKDKQGSFNHVRETLEKEFPKLKTQNGAFEFMRAERGGASRPLVPIPMQSTGYSIPFLKGALGSGIVYIRPIQSELSLEQDVKTGISSSDGAVTTKCINCNESVPLCSIRDHMNLCTVGSSGITPSNSQDLTNIAHDAPTDDQLQPGAPTGDAASWTDSLSMMFPTASKESLQKAVDIALTLEEAADLLCESQEIEAVSGAEGTENYGLALVGSVTSMSNEKAETKVVNGGLPSDRILKIFKEDVVTAGPSMPINFNRSKNPFRELCRIYKNSANKLIRPPVVYFISDSGDDVDFEEEAADIGGPLREFLTIAIETLSKGTAPQLFEGDDDHKLPVHSQQLVLNGYFKMTGEIVAHAIIHGEVWFAGLAKAVKVYLSTGCTETAAQVVCAEDVPDLNVREVLKRMSQAGEDEIASLNREDMVSNLIDESGVSVPFVTINNAAQVAYEIMVHQVIHKRLRELDEIRKGLNVLHLGTLLMDHPKVTSLVFPTVDEVTVDVHVLLARVKKDPTSCRSEKSDTAFGYFHEYLQNVCKRKEGTDIKSILTFITGSPLMPREVNVGFLPDEKGYPLPDPDTCSSSLKIPTCFSTYGQFEAAFDATVRIQGKGYGRA